ncbi:hypothetical protein FCM35_KLT20093 [Carex littledalei]|uniref:Uncharacterized protein n=1 Tax=Carex littledalei TaxID=544730 RepID=A0A833RGJ6_9POAL|nr:hypothetical protein FCM35_KLT20093 [Carex littledalei]
MPKPKFLSCLTRLNTSLKSQSSKKVVPAATPLAIPKEVEITRSRAKLLGSVSDLPDRELSFSFLVNNKSTSNNKIDTNMESSWNKDEKPLKKSPTMKEKKKKRAGCSPCNGDGVLLNLHVYRFLIPETVARPLRAMGRLAQLIPG